MSFRVELVVRGDNEDDAFDTADKLMARFEEQFHRTRPENVEEFGVNYNDDLEPYG